jgi:hypothetical protein
MPRVACHRGLLLLGPNLALALAEANERFLGLFLSQEVEVGQEVSLTIESSLHLRPLKFTGKVVSCAKVPKGIFRVSVELDKRLEWCDLIRFT